MGKQIEPVLYTAVVPLLAAAAMAWLGRRVLPQNVAERYVLGIALAVGFFSGYWLLPNDWAPLIPTKHWHWLPYLSAAAVIGGLAATLGVSWPERLVAYGLLSLVAAWQLVPLWEELQPSRPYSVPLLASYLTVLAALLAALPDRLLGSSFVGLLVMAAGAVALMVAVGVSLKYGQVAAIAAAALAGCFGASLLAVTDKCPLVARGVIPVFVLLVGSLAYVGTIEPSPPIPILLVAPAAPLMLWLFAAGPMARWKGLPGIAAQSVAVGIPLAIALVWVVLRGETEGR
jgi:hypothetical protein